MSNLTVLVSPKLQKFLKGPKKLFINGQFVESVSKKHFPLQTQQQVKIWLMCMKGIKQILI